MIFRLVGLILLSSATVVPSLGAAVDGNNVAYRATCAAINKAVGNVYYLGEYLCYHQETRPAHNLCGQGQPPMKKTCTILLLRARKILPALLSQLQHRI
jgi:hypothetical protein